MPYSHQFVCLASSKKPYGHCIAGKLWGGENHGVWIRPVSNREHDSISDAERTYTNGQAAQVRDLTSATFSGPQNHPYQNENHLILHPPLWTSHGHLSLSDLTQLEDHPARLWESGHHSRCGVNDRVPPEFLRVRRASLFLIRPERISVRVSAESAQWGNPRLKARASFTYNRIQYAFSVTDELAERHFLGLGAGTHHPEGITYFTVSLGDIDPNTGYAYKLVAAIL